MPHFARNSCIAYTWTEDGDCRAVMVKRAGDKCKVTRLWNAKADQNTSIAEILSNASKAMNAKDAAFTVASGLGAGWDMADVTMPNLPAEELRNAIAFELRKHTPLPLDKIRWGFRTTIAPQDKKQGVQTRIVYLKSDVFEQWTNYVSGLGQLDEMIPPPAVLDPLFAEDVITIPESPSSATAYAPSPDGRIASPADNNLSLDRMFPGSFIKWNELENLSDEEQRAYAPAILLAVYGLTHAAAHDTATMLQLPSGLKPRRHIAMTFCASILACITLLALCFYAAISLQGRNAQIRTLEKEIKKVNAQINEIDKQIKPEKKKAIAELKKEMTGVAPNLPPLPLVLLDLSKSIPSPAWLSGNFTWDEEGKVRFTLEEPVTDPTLTAKIDTQELQDTIEDSPYIGDVQGLKSNYDARNSKRTRDFDMRARFDSPAEAERARKRNQERAEAAQRKAAEERKAKEEQMKAEAAQNQEGQSEDAEQPTENGLRSVRNPSGSPNAGFSRRNAERRNAFSRPQNDDGNSDNFNDRGFPQPPDGGNFPQPPNGGNFPQPPNGDDGNRFNLQNFPGEMPPAPPMIEKNVPIR